MAGFSAALLFAVTALAAPTATTPTNITYEHGLPIVDLGYELHQAAFYNDTGNYYNFSNIRYAAPPVGNLRFAAPHAPAVDRSSVQTGSVGKICPQAVPAWEAITAEFLPEYLAGLPINVSTTIPSGGGQLPPVDPRTTEDCLFLDVLVPKDVLECVGDKKGVPVLVWIYGGGFIAGEKGQNAAGLIRRSDDGIIFVSLNYRLGAMGFLSGPTFQKEDGTPNAGLLDQRFALEWIQKNIATFGGDPDQVTIIGESAGGASVMHQITAYGGNKDTPFKRAIAQSPGFLPTTSTDIEDKTFETFLSILNVTTLAEARQLPSEAVILANALQVGGAPFGAFVFGPVVDGDFAPKLPGVLLLDGDFESNVEVMVGHNGDEGLLFTSPFVTNDTTFAAYIHANYPTIPDSSLNYILTVLYPPVYDGSYGYTDPIGRAALATSESIFVCNTFYLDTAFHNQTYAYKFVIPPALHGEDVPYTFYNDGGYEPANLTDFDLGLLSVDAALTLQDWIVTFAKTGKPSAPDVPSVPDFPKYGRDAKIAQLSVTGVTIQKDDAASARCEWWQTAFNF